MDHDRRSFIRAVGVGGVGAVAGCSSITGGDDTPTEESTPTEGSSGGDDTPTEESTPTETDEGGDDGDGGESSGPSIITVEGAGADIWNNSDLGHFYYTQVSGDFDVRVQVDNVENTNAHAKGGLMMRESMNPDSRNVMIRRRPNFGISPQWRPEDGASTTSTTSEDGAPLSRVDGGYMEGVKWQRLERSGDTIRCYGSEDGEEWIMMVELSASEIEFSDEVLLGLAVTSHNQAEAATAKFRGWEGPELTENEDIGNPLVPGSVSIAQPAIISGIEASEQGPNSVSLTGTLESMGGADSVDVWYEYREATADEWQTTETQSVSETGEVTTEFSGLTSRRYYQYRAYTDNGETEFSTVNQLFSTTSGSDGSSEEGPASNAEHDPSDGFADLAPWADDDTPIVTVSEPTREALEAATSVAGPRIVVFETSGTIDLGAEDLNIRQSKCWIAGQTAPSPGITIVRGGVWLYGNDIAIQHIRVRPGDAGKERGSGWQPDAIEAADDTTGNVIDHCTGTWSVDENINIGYDTDTSTISNCLMAEPLNDSTHSKGEHGYNSIIGDRAKNVSLMGNIYALGIDRNPRLKQGTETVVVNNFVHHYSDGMWADPDTAHAIVGNVFEDPQTDQANIFGEGEVYAEGNVQNTGDAEMIGDSITQLDSEPHWPENMEAASADSVKETNLANAGARPADRTETDQRIIENIRNGEGGVIDSQEEVGGYPDLEENTAEVEPPTSGLVAWLREQAVAVEAGE